LKRFSLCEKKSVLWYETGNKTTLKRFNECLYFPQFRQALSLFVYWNFEVTHKFRLIDNQKLKGSRAKLSASANFSFSKT